MSLVDLFLPGSRNRKNSIFVHKQETSFIKECNCLVYSSEISVMTGVSVASDASLHVVIHPLVLLSAADHYNRVAKDTKKRVVGVLLGSRSRDMVDVTNSFAVPFEEDLKNPSVWFLDHNFLETMYWMFKKVNSE